MWPQHIVVRPSVRSLVKAGSPSVREPVALDPSITKKYEEGIDALRSAEEGVTKATERLVKLVEEKAAVDGKASGINRWSNKGGTLAQQERLLKEIEICQAEKEKAHALHNALIDCGKPYKDAIDIHEESNRKYVEHMATVKKYRDLSKELWADL